MKLQYVVKSSDGSTSAKEELICTFNDDKMQPTTRVLSQPWENDYLTDGLQALNVEGNVLEVGYGLGHMTKEIEGEGDVGDQAIIEQFPACQKKIKDDLNEVNTLTSSKRSDYISLYSGRWEDVIGECGKFKCAVYHDFFQSEDSRVRFFKFLMHFMIHNSEQGAEVLYYSQTSEPVNFTQISYEVSTYDNTVINKCDKYEADKPLFFHVFKKDVDFDSKVFVEEVNNYLNPETLDISDETEKAEQSNKFISGQNRFVVANSLETSLASPTCGIMVIDNFYNNPMETRNFILTQDFNVSGNYPGVRTKSFATEEIKQMIQNYVGPFGGNIVEFPMDDSAYNGAFQITTSRDRSWVHTDGWNNWAGVLYMTPDAPLTSGTATFMHIDGERYSYVETDENGQKIPKTPDKTKFDRDSQDMTKWHKVDEISNVFNRLILFNANQFHSSLDYFGQNLQDGRLFQTFFFSTER
tara:strand:- start:1481 stop:2884 length:1404 start_codon:yes stop_codon:yes gene_type:complete